MRPTPIPDEEIWQGTDRVVILPPGGDMTDTTISSVEALRGMITIARDQESGIVNEVPFNAVRIVLEKGDLERLQGGEPYWLVMMAPFMVPFSIVFRDEARLEDTGEPV